MKFRYTKERKRDRTEFVYQYREEIEKLINQSQNFHPSADAIKFVDSVVRKKLGYGCKTNTIDIWLSITKCYSQMGAIM